MSRFGTELKKERKAAKKKLRELSDELQLSIGYISDIEQGRKGAPDLEIVDKIETFLGISDKRLRIIAVEERTKMPTEMTQKIQQRPKLSELFFSVRDMSDEELEELINNTREK